MSDSPTDKSSDRTKISFRDSFKVIAWAVRIAFRVDPLISSLLLLGSIFGQLRFLANSYIFALIIDEAIKVTSSPDGNLSSLFPYLIALGLFNLASILINEVENYSRNLMRQRNGLFLRRELYLQANKLGIETLEDPDIANNLQRAGQNVYDLPFFLRSVAHISGRLVAAIVAGVILFSYLPIFIPIFILVSVPRMIVETRYLNKLWKFELDTTEKHKKNNWTYSSLVNPESLKEVKITNSFSFLDKVFTNFAGLYKKSITSIYNRWYSFGFVLSAVNVAIEVAAIAVLFDRLLVGTLTVGLLTFQVRNLSSFYNDFFWGVFEVFNLRQWAIKMKDIKLVFDQKSKYGDGSIEISTRNAPRIEIKDLTFSYPNTEVKVLENLNLDIKPGEKVAIVGKNGAGKTTLVKLLSRFYRPTKGKIEVNSNLDLNDVRLESWYDMIDVVYQDYNRYGFLSVRENVAIGRAEANVDDKKIIQALKDADAWDFVKDYKNGLDQVLSERFEDGIRPSGGQWQKIALARFFYSNSPLIVFDEPTAAIDAESEYKIFNKIYDFFKDKTVIIISHRFSTVRNADRIVLLEGGKIIEDGSHDELMKLDGRYAEMFKLQATGYQ